MIPAELKPKSAAAIILHAMPSWDGSRQQLENASLQTSSCCRNSPIFFFKQTFCFESFASIYSVCFCINCQGIWLVSDQMWQQGSYCDTVLLNFWLHFEPHSLCHRGPLFGGKAIDMSTVLSRQTPKTPAPLSFVHMHHLR